MQTFSLISITPFGGATVAKEEGTKRFTPAAFAAVARGFWSSRPCGSTVAMMTSMPCRTLACWSVGLEVS